MEGWIPGSKSLNVIGDGLRVGSQGRVTGWIPSEGRGGIQGRNTGWSPIGGIGCIHGGDT